MRWFESLNQPEAFGPPQQPPDVRLAIKAWNLLGGVLDWSGLSLVAEILGYDDIELLIAQLVAIRDREKE
jgi:hypothetical protein